MCVRVKKEGDGVARAGEEDMQSAGRQAMPRPVDSHGHARSSTWQIRVQSLYIELIFFLQSFVTKSSSGKEVRLISSVISGRLDSIRKELEYASPC